jgi:hypothetical protein
VGRGAEQRACCVWGQAQRYEQWRRLAKLATTVAVSTGAGATRGAEHGAASTAVVPLASYQGGRGP